MSSTEAAVASMVQAAACRRRCSEFFPRLISASFLLAGTAFLSLQGPCWQGVSILVKRREGDRARQDRHRREP